MIKDKITEYEKAIKAIKVLEKNPNILKYYPALDQEKRFSNLMLLYSKINPTWKEDYEKVEKGKPREIRTDLKFSTMEDFVKSVQGSGKILESTLAMHSANKIAHKCGFYRDEIIRGYVTDLYKEKNRRINEKRLKSICILVQRYLDPANTTDPKTLEEQRIKLEKLGIREQHIEELKQIGIEKLSIAQRDAFYIKDFEMDRAIEYLKDDDEISYGKCTKIKKDENGTEKEEHLLVIDLPYYGQFSVHMKTSSSISALSETPYDHLRIYEKKTSLLSDEISEWVACRIKGKTFEDALPLLKKIKSEKENGPRIAHYMALKLGATKSDLDKLYDENER